MRALIRKIDAKIGNFVDIAYIEPNFIEYPLATYSPMGKYKIKCAFYKEFDYNDIISIEIEEAD